MKKQDIHLGHIESLRAIAALMVLIFHFISFEDPKGPLVSNESVRKYSEFGAQGVELFYLISGFVIYYSLSKGVYGFKHYPKYLLKRITRIFPPFWGIILLICLAPLMWDWPFPYSANQVVQNATLTVDLFGNTEWMNPIFVTLKVEFMFYLIIGLLVVVMKRNDWSYGIIVFSSLVAAYYFCSFDLAHNIPFFLIGIVCCEIYKTRQIVLNYCLMASCLLFLCLFFPVEDLVISLIGVVFLLWIPITNRAFRFTGQFSYSLYLTHGFSGGLFLTYCKNQKGVDWNPWVYIVLAVIGSLVFAYCYFLVIEKRAMGWSKGIRY
ncbi:acyltransferase [Fluviicola sp.]|uniref:acyltransferase family protein n=1 Tax=Fluviicola sp. TaxID=1917219 RepID=UPI0031DD37B9